METHKAHPTVKEMMNPEWVGKELGHLFHKLSFSSKIVTSAKIIFGIFAAALILALILWPMTNSFDKKMKMTFTNIPNGEAETPTMVNPRFHGIDRNEKPYTVFADSAVQTTPDMMLLTNISSEMASGTGWMSLLSGKGEMNIPGKTVELHDSVHLFFDSGYEFITEKAHVDMGKSTAFGNENVEVQGPLGTLNAGGFRTSGKDNEIFFKGPIEVITFPKNKTPETAAKP